VEWAATREGLAAGAPASGAAALFAATLPDLLDPEIARQLGARGIPAIAGLRTAMRCAQALRRPPADPARLRQIAAAATGAAASEFEDGWLAEAEAKELLRAAGVPVPEGRVATDAEDAVAAAREIGWPVALKLSAPSLLHKSEAGALALALTDETMVRAADARLRALPAAGRAEVLVERMAAGGIEFFVAARADGVVPALVIGLGGIWAEAFDDVAIVPLPANPERIERGLRSLRASAVLHGGRGSAAIDLQGLTELAARAGQLALDRRLALLELNPVAVGAEGAVALDALARLSG
jgi:acetate---CoA ligase (ADP-forming)